MTIIGLLLIGVPFIGLCAVILVMGFADIWSERGNRTPRETAAHTLERNGDPVEKVARNERATGSAEQGWKRFIRTSWRWSDLPWCWWASARGDSASNWAETQPVLRIPAAMPLIVSKMAYSNFSRSVVDKSLWRLRASNSTCR